MGDLFGSRKPAIAGPCAFSPMLVFDRSDGFSGVRLTSFHKYLRFCDLCKELAFLALQRKRCSRDFIQLVRAQHVLPPVPGEPNGFKCAHGETGTPEGKASSHQNEDSEAATRS